jgi:phosphate-selective porin OprO/OprP
VVYPSSLAAEDKTDLNVVADNDSLPQSEEFPEENREVLSGEIAENTQTALSLKRLLLGRSYIFFGRIEGDGAIYSGDAFEGENGGEIRRFRVGIAGVLSDHLSYKGELDLTDKSTTVSDFYLKLDTLLLGSLTIGNQFVSQNLSAMTGSLSLLFMEDPLPVTTFSLSRRLSVGQDYHADRWGGHGMIFFRDPNNDAGDKGWAMRAYINPTRKSSGISHMGFSAVREKMSDEARYRTRPESHVTDIRLVDTGQFQDVDYQNILGLEVAGAVGSFTGRMEAFKSTWDRTGGVKNDFYGAYMELGYFLTGQSFNYRQGKFVRPKLGDGTHAWEIGFRASWVDLNDKEIQGGEQFNLGLALNYYLKQNFRIQSNLLHIDSESTAGNENSWIIQARIQYNW